MAQRTTRTTGPARAAKAPARKPVIPVVGWNEARAAPVVLVSGAEDLLADRAIRRIREAMVGADSATEVSDIDAATCAPGELLTLASPSLFGEPRLIRVAALERTNDVFLEDALRYLESPADDTVLVLRHGGGVRGKKLLDAVRAGTGGGIEVTCAEITRDGDRADFAAAEFRSAGRRIAPAALRSLVTAFAELGELASACQQLIADTTGDVTERTVERYYAGRVETNAFQVADAALAGRRGDALVLLRHALDSGADPVPMVAAIAMKLRTMARVMDVRGPSAQVAGETGLAPWQIDRARRDAAGWDTAGVGRCMALAATTDERVKGASRDPVYALERLVTLVAARGVPDGR